MNHLLYTRGSIPFFETYTGLYVPRMLGFRREACEQTARFLGAELLALTKMDWNNTQFDGKDPIARKPHAVSEPFSSTFQRVIRLRRATASICSVGGV